MFLSGNSHLHRHLKTSTFLCLHHQRIVDLRPDTVFDVVHRCPRFESNQAQEGYLGIVPSLVTSLALVTEPLEFCWYENGKPILLLVNVGKAGLQISGEEIRDEWLKRALLDSKAHLPSLPPSFLQVEKLSCLETGRHLCRRSHWT